MKKYQIYLLSVLIFLFIWSIISFIIKSPLILPSPSFIFAAMLQLITKGVFWSNFIFTFYRVIICFGLAVISGTILGIACGLNKGIETFFEFPLALIKSTPVAAIILMALFWFKSGTVPVIIGVLMALPIMSTAVSSSIKDTDSKLLEMSRSFSFSKKERLFYIYKNRIFSGILQGCHQTYGLSWKVVCAGEVLSLPRYAIGTYLQYAQVHIETASVMAAAFLLIIFSILIEKIFCLLVKLIQQIFC